jgi:hypothetical protein
MACSHRRLSITIALVAALMLAAAAAAACSARATAESASPAPSAGRTLSADAAEAASEADGASGSGAGARGASGTDWGRVLAALAWMQADTPTAPVVVLLGGSAARESTISDRSWRDQIVARGGPETLAWNMGSGNRTMALNVAIVRALPRDAEAIIYIGVNLGSFTSTQKTASITLPSPAPTSSPSLQQPHRYSTATGILSTAKKKALVQAWRANRYPVFTRSFSTSAAVLETLVRVCQARGYKPVLFELPRNTAVIGSSLSAPTTRFRDKCRALAAQYRIPWVSFVRAAGLPNQDFYDLWHLVEPGRTVWQDLLSAKTAALLRQYGFDGGGS